MIEHCCSWFSRPLFLLVATTGLVIANSNAEVISPNLGEPVRDAAVLRGPDGSWYLTGTTAWNPDQESPDFHNNRGVRVWSSKDLRTWKDEGFVWDLWKDPGTHHGDWQTELYPVPGRPSGERARGFTAPRLAHDGGRFWITYSMNGYGAGAMPGGEAVASPYKDTKLLAEAGGAETARSDASLFVDSDGKRYLVWGGGMIAPLKSPESLAKLKDNEVGFEGSPVFLPAQIEGFFTDTGLPEHGMPYGVSVFRDGDESVFLYSASTLRDGKLSEDAYMARGKSLFGPYGRPELLKAGAGRVTAFVGPDGKPWISFTPQDSNQPTLEPMPTAVKAVASTPPAAPKSGEIVTAVPRRAPSEKPSDVPQMLEMIEPVMDHPLRDAAITQGPDGIWYMTGTEASRAADGTLDWSNNRGIRLWSSPDRKTWTDVGYVWEIEKHGSDREKGGHLDLTVGAEPRIGRGVSAPEIHYMKGTFWIPYSVNGMQSGLLKSTTGKAEGPYENLGIMTRTGRDPSLFQDGETVYWVLGNGLIAKMKDDMSGLAEAPRPLFTGVKWYPRYMRRLENHGIWGSHLRKQGDWYVWVFTTRSGRGGINAIDTMATWSKSLEGPWAEPCLMLANGGQSTLVPDGKGGWLATVSGEDEYSNHPYRACITPVVTDGRLGQPLQIRPLAENAVFTNWQTVNSWHATALDLWKGHPNFIPHPLRDVFILRDKDGTYYCTGSFWGDDELRRDVVFFKSKDLMHWEKRPPVYSYKQLADDGMIAEKDLPAFHELIEKDAEGTNWRYRIQIGEQKIWPMGGTYYMNAQAFCKPGGHLLLKSTSGNIEGPYKPIQWIAGVADLMQDDDGAILLNFSGVAHRRFPTLADFENSPQSTGPNVQRVEYAHAEKPFENILFSEDCEAGLMKIGGKYVTWTTDWTGSYDAIYRFADQPEGPYHGKMRMLPYGGNGKFFQDETGQWFYTYFFNSNEYASREQNYVRMNMYPVFVGMEDGELIIEPEAVRENRAALEKMGALWQSPR